MIPRKYSAIKNAATWTILPMRPCWVCFEPIYVTLANLNGLLSHSDCSVRPRRPIHPATGSVGSLVAERSNLHHSVPMNAGVEGHPVMYPDLSCLNDPVFKFFFHTYFNIVSLVPDKTRSWKLAIHLDYFTRLSIWASDLPCQCQIVLHMSSRCRGHICERSQNQPKRS